MFGSVVLDVVIGLVFVYLLYSLLATILAELVSSWLGIRARMLRQAIERMLNDRYFEDLTRNRLQRIWHSIIVFFLLEFKDFRFSLAGRLYNHPAIKYLGRGKSGLFTLFSNRKPSYIRPENFADTLIQMMKERGTGTTDIEKVASCLQLNTLQIQPQTLTMLRNLFSDSGNDVAGFKKKLTNWYDEMMERLAGWFKRKIQLVLFIIGLIMAISFNVDSIGIARRLAKDKSAREQLVQMAISASDSSSAIAKAIGQTNDSTVSDSLLKESYRQVKQATDDASVVLGLGWNLGSLVKPQRKTIPAAAIVLAWNHSAILPGSIPGRQCWSADPVTIKRMAVLYTDSVQHCITRLEQMLRSARKDSVKQLISRKLAIVRGKEKAFTDTLNYFAGTSFNRLHRIQSAAYNQVLTEGTRTYRWYEKIGYILGKTWSDKVMLLGFIITALAVSLGSNFWFDLLNKLVSIRSAGIKPEEAPKEKQPQANSVTSTSITEKTAPHAEPAPVVPDTVFTAELAKFSEKLLKIPGVKSVFKGMTKKGGEMVTCIQINVTDADTRLLVEKKVEKMDKGDIVHPVIILETGDVVTHHSMNAGQIRNSSGKNVTGTAGCYFRHRETGRFHLLSCWHVMKGNLRYDEDDNDTLILGPSSEPIGNRWAGGISESVDFAFARVLPKIIPDNKFLSGALGFPSITCREVTQREINQQLPVVWFDTIQQVKREGVIYTDGPSVLIHYPDKMRYVKDLLVLTGDSSGKPGPFSMPGNSGSLVFDRNGAAIAIIIAGDSMYSYAAKLSNILPLFPELEMI
jgi:hypothetical protein